MAGLNGRRCSPAALLRFWRGAGRRTSRQRRGPADAAAIAGRRAGAGGGGGSPGGRASGRGASPPPCPRRAGGRTTAGVRRRWRCGCRRRGRRSTPRGLAPPSPATSARWRERCRRRGGRPRGAHRRGRVVPGDALVTTTRATSSSRRRGAVARSSSALAAAPDDAELLLRLIPREDEAAAVHDGVVASQEPDHAPALRTLLDALGRQAPRGAASAPPRTCVVRDLADRRVPVGAARPPRSEHFRTAGTDPRLAQPAPCSKARIEAGLDPFTSDP